MVPTLSLAGERLFEGHFLLVTPQGHAYRHHQASPHRKNVSLEKAIDALGEMSAREQFLKQPITVYETLANTNHKLYLSVEPDFATSRACATGFIKVGEKKLFVTDGAREQVAVSALCVLDFYVLNSEQRKGWGKRIFDFMLQMENASPVKIAYDRPSPKLTMFLRKHYGLIDCIWQPNRYAIYGGFFERHDDGSPSTDGRKKTNSSISRLYNGKCLREATLGLSPDHRRRADSIAEIIHGGP